MRNGRRALGLIVVFLFFIGCTRTQAPLSPEARRHQEEQEEQARFELELAHPLQPSLPADRASRGGPGAPITIVEFADFQCPFCKQGFDRIEALKKLYGNKIRFFYKNYPLPFHNMAMPAAQRFEAIALQSVEKAYQFHDEVFTNQSRLNAEGVAFLDSVAQKTGIDMVRLKKDMTSEKVANHLTADFEEANQFEITGTPAFIINGVSIRGIRPLERFKEIIEKTLLRDHKKS